MQGINKKHQPLILDDAKKTTYYQEWDDELSFRGWMGLPLVARDLVLGYLTFDSCASRAFSPEDAALAQSFSLHIAQAIYNARLHKEIQEKFQQVKTLNAIISALTTSLDIDELLELILEQIKGVLPLDSGAIFLYEEDELRVAVDYNILPSLKGKKFSEENGTFKEVMKKQIPVIINNVLNNADFKNWGKTENIKHWMGVPLIVREEFIGFLTLDSHDVDITYSAEHIDLVKPFASQAAQAIYNARLYTHVIRDSNEIEKRVQERTEELQKFACLTADREIRMAELKEAIAKLRTQLIEADQVPIADDPLRYSNR
jgi:GAF domain-containing protein